MSMPVLLTVFDTNAASAGASSSLLDDHITSCASYVESAAAVSQKYPTNTVKEFNDYDIKDTVTACVPTLHKFTVQLSAELETNELVGLTGDAKALGEWQLNRSVALQRLPNYEWSTNVLLQTCREISYRYFVYILDKNGYKQIRRWETELKPRIVKLKDINSTKVDSFGVIETNSNNSISGQQINRGWLTNESIVQLKFEREKMFKIFDIEKFYTDNMLIKVVELRDDLVTALEPTESDANIEVTKFKYAESFLQPQQSFGVSYNRGAIIIFHITVSNSIRNNFAIVFYTPEMKPMGKAVITADDLNPTKTMLELNITEPTKESNTVIAHLCLPYLIVKPYLDVSFDFRTTYAHYWPKSWPHLDVGHRGNGRSYIANAPIERENTLKSFQHAYENFADMIELDVHLTLDFIPIIYHDFGVRTAPRDKVIMNASQLEFVLIKDITYEALKNLRVFALINGKPVEYPSYNEEPQPQNRIFPTLVDVLEGLPKTLGIDVEIKWPQLRVTGDYEAEQIVDKNAFIDRVLSDIIKYGCGRPLIFSSFDGDICTMLRFKQNIFPVMFLTMGETKKWSPFMDLRTRTFEQAINNAQAFELAGTAPHAEDFLDDNGRHLMEKANNLGQITLVWGDDCNSKKRVEYFRDIGATAVCFDRTDLFMPDGKERSFFNSSAIMAEFAYQCRQ